jgi:hypothetical protein
VSSRLWASLVVAFVVLSALAYPGAPRHSITGTIVQLKAGEWIAVASEQQGHSDLQIALRATTAYEGNPEALHTGAGVTVWWKSVGERHFVADKVRVPPASGIPPVRH